jgi:hypothetical protein
MKKTIFCKIKKNKKYIKEEKGAIAILMAFAIVALVGASALVVDLGLSYHKAAKLQHALDSAVLAAVQELPADGTSSSEWITAVDKAKEYGSANGVSEDEIEISPIHENGIIVGVEADGNKIVDYTLARVLGFNRGNLNRIAAAKVYTVAGMSGIIPLAITQQRLDTMDPMDSTIIKFDSKNNEDLGVNGWYGAADLKGGGGNAYRENFKHGCDKIISVGDNLEIESGNMVGPTSDAYNFRISGHEDCTPTNFCDNCPRVVTVPIVEVVSKKNGGGKGNGGNKNKVNKGNSKLLVTSFATVFLADMEKGGGNNCDITAVLLEKNFVDGEPGEVGKDNGVYTTKLIN